MPHEPPSPPYPDGVAMPDTPTRRGRRLAIGLVVVALVALAASVLWFTRSPGPPTVPVGLQTVPNTCDDPCETIEPRVTLEWAPPESGADPTGFRLLRDGATLDAEFSGFDLAFVDDSVTMGERYQYQVVALSEEGDSPPSEPVDAAVPTPPDGAAHLDGVYDVSLTVRSARSIGAAFGIEDPLPGKRAPIDGRSRPRAEPTKGRAPPHGRVWKATSRRGDRGGRAGSRGCRRGAVATGARPPPSTCPSGRSTRPWSTERGS